MRAELLGGQTLQSANLARYIVTPGRHPLVPPVEERQAAQSYKMSMAPRLASYSSNAPLHVPGSGHICLNWDENHSVSTGISFNCNYYSLV